MLCTVNTDFIHISQGYFIGLGVVIQLDSALLPWECKAISNMDSHELILYQQSIQTVRIFEDKGCISVNQIK